jgi:hypothetical protein
LRSRHNRRQPAASSGSRGAPALAVVYAITSDDTETGEPTVPGFLDDGLNWRVIAHFPDGRTRWCGLGLQFPAEPPPLSFPE